MTVRLALRDPPPGLMAEDNQFWVDADVPLCGDLAAAGVAAARGSCPADERCSRAFRLPGYRLQVEGFGRAASDLLCLAFAHLAVDEPEVEDKAAETLHWTIVDRAHAPGVPAMPTTEPGDSASCTAVSGTISCSSGGGASRPCSMSGA